MVVLSITRRASSAVAGWLALDGIFGAFLVHFCLKCNKFSNWLVMILAFATPDLWCGGSWLIHDGPFSAGIVGSDGRILRFSDVFGLVVQRHWRIK